MSKKKKARLETKREKRDPFEVFKTLAETNAILEERTSMMIERTVSEMQERILAWTKEMWGEMVRARLDSVAKIYKEEPKKPGDLR